LLGEFNSGELRWLLDKQKLKVKDSLLVASACQLECKWSR